jgi:aspartate/methionine/tyrosine aminotransferase
VDLLEFFSKYYSPDLIDFSSSSAPAGFEPACMGGEDLDYVAPTGADDLRELIASDYEGLTRENIVLASGASEALVAFAHAVLDARSIVWCARGMYPSFVEATSRLGVQVRNSPLPEPHLDVLALCNPTVPDGQVLNPGVFDRARWLLVDESHIDLVHQGPKPRRAAGISPRTVSAGGISKGLGLGGVRLGWLAALDTDLCARVDREVQLLSGGPSAMAVATAQEALEQRESLTRRTIEQVRKNAPAVYRALDEAGWRARTADAGLTCEAWPPDDAPQRLDRLLLAAGYFLIPCDVYGTPGSYRISLLADASALREALGLVSFTLRV